MCQRITSLCACWNRFSNNKTFEYQKSHSQIKKSQKLYLLISYNKLFSHQYFLFYTHRIVESESNNDINSTVRSINMGNQTSGPKKRPEIGITGTLSRNAYGGNNGTSSVRLPIPNDEELEKRCFIYISFAFTNYQI